MKDQVITKVLEYIENIGSVVSKSTEYGFEMLVRNQLYEGVTGSVLVLLGFIVTLVFIILAVKKYKQSNKKESDPELSFLVFSGFSVLFGFISFINLFRISEMVLKILNPEYYAIKEIIDVISGSK